MTDKYLLTIDAVINLTLGVLLLLVPFGMAELLGVPVPVSPFYAVILGGVLFGIGLALLVERYKDRLGVSGLGLGGAICINLCGAGVLFVWLLFTAHSLPLKGLVILWSIVIIILGLSMVELLGQINQKRKK